MKDKFYVGAKVVCTRSHTGHRKGVVYEIQGVSKFPCKCKHLVLDLGIRCRAQDCEVCVSRELNTHGICYGLAEYFRLLEPDTELSELSINELLDEILDNDKMAKRG